uniref:FTH domain-containing protein n=1 Tax=Caenorhabditis tropicalis TaxID=1561998 RepID=A0A1I7V1Q4_9PELO
MKQLSVCSEISRTYERRLRSSEAALHDFTALMSNQYLSIRNLHLHIRVPEGLYFLTKFVEALTEIQWKRGGQIGLEKLFLFADGFFPMVLTSVEAFQRDQLSVLEIEMGNLVEVSQLRALFGWETIERFIFIAGTIIELDNISIFGNVSQMTMNALLTTEDAIRFRDMFMRKPKFERFLVYLHRLSGIRFDSLAEALGMDSPVLRDGQLIHREPIPNSHNDMVLTARPPNTFLLEMEPRRH